MDNFKLENQQHLNTNQQYTPSRELNIQNRKRGGLIKYVKQYNKYA